MILRVFSTKKIPDVVGPFSWQNDENCHNKNIAQTMLNMV